MANGILLVMLVNLIVVGLLTPPRLRVIAVIGCMGGWLLASLGLWGWMQWNQAPVKASPVVASSTSSTSSGGGLAVEVDYHYLRRTYGINDSTR